MTQDGDVTASLAAGIAQDAATNPNTASTSTDNTVTYNVDEGDVTPPTVTINQAATQVDPTSVSPIVFDVVFSEPVTGFTTGDVTLNSTAGTPLVGTVAGSGTTYTVSVTGMTQDGDVTASLAAGIAQDAATNPNTASTSTDNTVTYNFDEGDHTPPTVTINQAATQVDPTSVSPIVFDVVFSEPVTGFTTGDVTLNSTAGTPLVGTVAGSGTTYTVSVTGMTQDGDVTASLAAGIAQDASNQPQHRLHIHRQHRHLQPRRRRPHAADGDDQPGSHPGRPDIGLTNRVRCRVLRTRHRLHHRRRHLEQHRRHTTRRHRRRIRNHLHRQRHRHDPRRRRHREPRRRHRTRRQQPTPTPPPHPPTTPSPTTTTKATSHPRR